MPNTIQMSTDPATRVAWGEEYPILHTAVGSAWRRTFGNSRFTWNNWHFCAFPNAYVADRHHKRQTGPYYMKRNMTDDWYSNSRDPGWYGDWLLVGDYVYGTQPHTFYTIYRPIICKIHLPTGTITESTMSWRWIDTKTSTPGDYKYLATNQVVKLLGHVQDWVLMLAKATERWEVVAISKRDLDVVVPARRIPELEWLVEGVEKYSYQSGYDTTTNAMEVVPNLNSGELTSYVYVGIIMQNPPGRFANSYMFVDFINKEVRAVSGPLMNMQSTIMADRKGIMYYANTWTMGTVDPFERTHRVYVPTAQYKYFNTPNIHNVNAGRRVWPWSPWEMAFVTANGENAVYLGQTMRHLIVIDVMKDELRIEAELPSVAGVIQTDYSVYMWMDNEGNFFTVGAADPESMSGAGLYSERWIGKFSEGGVFPSVSAGLKTLGDATHKWGVMHAGTIQTSGVQDSRLMRIASLQHESDSTALSPLEITSEDEGATLRVSGSRWRKARLTNAITLPDPDVEKGVFGITGEQYGILPEPAPLPDWFNGCTPVVRDGKWVAGDAIFDMPELGTNSDNIIFVSENKRWTHKYLPFSVTFTSLTAAFTNLMESVPIWYVISAANFTNQANDAVQYVDGYSSGTIRPLPGAGVANWGLDRTELGISGNFTNKYWLGEEGLSNRPLTNFNHVNNVGTGRWEVGDILETLRKNVQDWYRGWHYITEMSTVNRIDDYEPNTIWGEDAKELFTMLGRFMSRMFMKGAVPQGTPVEVQVQVSLDPTFATGVTERTTATDTTGWWFEHTDGGQSPLLPEGPAGTTVVGVVFDPSLAGVDYDLQTHHARWRKSLYGIFGEWSSAEFIDVEDRWYGIEQIEDQKSVSHFVLQDLVDKGWLFTKREVSPIGGASIFIRESVGVGDRIDVELDIGDSILWAHAERRDTLLDKTGWSIVTDETVDAYPDDSTFAAPHVGDVHIVFDPQAAAVTSRVGTRYYRYRIIRNGVTGKWKVRSTATTENCQTRIDMVSVIGHDSMRLPEAPVPIVKDANNRVAVSDTEVRDATDWEFNEDRYGLVPDTPMEGPVLIISEGITRTETSIPQYWRNNTAVMTASRREGDYPAMYEYPAWGVGPSNLPYNHMQPGLRYYTVAPYCSYTAYTYYADRPNYVTWLPGSSRVHFARREHSGVLGDPATSINVHSCKDAVLDETGRFIVHVTNEVAYCDNHISIHDLVLRTNYYAHDLSVFSLFRKPVVLRDGLILIPTVMGTDEPVMCEPYTGIVHSFGTKKYSKFLYPVNNRSGTFYPYRAANNASDKNRPIMGYRGIHSWRNMPDAREYIFRIEDDEEPTFHTMTAYAQRFHATTKTLPADTFFQTWDQGASSYSSYGLGGMERVGYPYRNGWVAASYLPWMVAGALVSQMGLVASCGDWSGLYSKSPSVSTGYALQVLCPGASYASVALSQRMLQIHDTVWYNYARGLSKSHNIERLARMPAGYGVGLGGMNVGLFAADPSYTHYSFGPGKNLYAFEVGDVFAGLWGLKGEYYARLAFRSKVGRGS